MMKMIFDSYEESKQHQNQQQQQSFDDQIATRWKVEPTIHDPLFELIWNTNHNHPQDTNDSFLSSSGDGTGSGLSSPTGSTGSVSSESGSFFFFSNQNHQNQSDQLNLIPLVSSSPSFFDVTNGLHNSTTTNRSVPLLIFLSSLLICLILATIIGNVFVISAVILERSLRSVGNYLVVSLAITDLLVACLVMPIGAIYEVMGEWRMGIQLCELWTFIDVLCCTTSIFHLLAIACDRLWAVTTVDYIHRRKTKHVCLGIALIWLFSAIISLGPMLGWKDDEFERRITERHECMISQDISYQIFATIASFYAPSILLLWQYYRIYQVAKTRLKLKKQRYQHRIRRKPSFYRTRKESELKEFPRVSHRVSLNTNEELYSSTVVPPPSSTSGIYSSSTNTDYTTTATTNTTMSTDRASSIISISPTSMLKPPIHTIVTTTTTTANTVPVTTATASSNDRQLSPPFTSPVSPSNSNNSSNNNNNSLPISSNITPAPATTGKRFSIVQFFNPSHRKSENLDGEKFTMQNFDDYDPNDLRSNETSIDESTIIVAGNPSNIVVYVDDYGSTICSSCEVPEHFYSNTGDDDDDDEEGEEEDEDEDDEFIDSPVDDIAVDVTDPNDADSVIDEEMSIKQSESPEVVVVVECPTRKASRVSIMGIDGNNDQRNFLTPPPIPDIENTERIMMKPKDSEQDEGDNQNNQNNNNNNNHNNHHHHHHHHHNHRHSTCSKKKHKGRRRIRKLKFTNKILRFDNGNNSNENKQETKAAKTLTIITGVFIICWLPFFVLALVMPLCGHRCYINQYVFDFVTWLGWANSTLNPFLYTIFSPDFRNAFKKLLKRIKH